MQPIVKCSIEYDAAEFFRFVSFGLCLTLFEMYDTVLIINRREQTLLHFIHTSSPFDGIAQSMCKYVYRIGAKDRLAYRENAKKFRECGACKIH